MGNPKKAQTAHAERANRFALAFIASKNNIDSTALALGKLKADQYDVLAAPFAGSEPVTESEFNATYKPALEAALIKADFDPKSMAPMLNRLKLFVIGVTNPAKYPRLTIDGKPQALYAYVDHYRTTMVKNGDITPANKGNSGSTRTGTGKGGKASEPVEVAPEKVTRRTAAMVLLGTQETADVEFVMELITAANLPKLRAIAALLTK